MNQISAFLEAKMLFLCLFLLSCCLSLSAGNEIEEFKENLEAFVNLTKKQIFLPILKKNECKCAHDYLSNTEKYLEKLTEKFNDEPKAKERLHLMRFNMKQLMHRLEKGDKVNPSKSCGKTEVGLRRALKFYKGFFERLNEFNCIKSQ